MRSYGRESEIKPRPYDATILSDLDDVYRAAEDCGLENEFFSKDSIISEQLDALCKKLSCTPIQIVFLAIIAERNEYATGPKDICRYCNCSYLKVRQYDEELTDLLIRQFIIIKKENHRFYREDEDDSNPDVYPPDDNFRIDPSLFKSWTHNIAYSVVLDDIEESVTEQKSPYEVAKSILRKSDNSTCELIDPATIIEKELFYNEDEGKRVDELCRLLMQEKFEEICNEFELCRMRRAFSIILWGPPGTGKSELVNQIAKATGRPILKADYSTLRNRYVGDTEKAIRSMFRTYRSLVEGMMLAPILYLNECDGLLGQRVEVHEGTDSLNNSCQAILLEEMENLKGILIATSNLPGRMDKAYNRRFLFKIELTYPDANTRFRIWKNMLPDIPDSEITILAKDYSLSGGQIENIVRRYAVQRAIFCDKFDIYCLRLFCQEEITASDYNKRKSKSIIGF